MTLSHIESQVWFVKSKRAQSSEDYETWLAGGVVPTLNAFDVGDGRAVVLIIDGTRVGDVRVYEDQVMQTVITRWGTGGGNVPAIMNNEPIAFHRKQDPISGSVSPALGVTSEGMGIMHQTIMGTLTASNNPSRSPQSSEVTQQINSVHEATSIVRRLMPIECERLQGFPDDWTSGQADSHRYKQMGNAVAVPVVNWIIERLIEETQ